MGLRDDFNSLIAMQATRSELTEVIDQAAEYLAPVLREIEGIEAERAPISDVNDAKRFPRVSSVNRVTRAGSEMARILPRRIRERIHDRLSDVYKRLDDGGRELFAQFGLSRNSDLARLFRMTLSTLQTVGVSALDRDEKRELMDLAYAQRGIERKIMNKAASKIEDLNDRIERLWYELEPSDDAAKPAADQVVDGQIFRFQTCRKVH